MASLPDHHIQQTMHTVTSGQCKQDSGVSPSADLHAHVRSDLMQSRQLHTSMLLVQDGRIAFDVVLQQAQSHNQYMS